ncbi:P-loop containing nucleoside triphosphate hydrolase protein [Artomyces pyxidatus]|uniref:P-loop containing nucleoside triphosphate hydrolase protein n=1 Tax=Artomyces pyxidatus TaxID=48021 RepID=A0ACB8SW61_9AGAM|nr:P-loop containing nucleoside triphosphate hydrolase protein [Artomyces pyxidatus]
MSLDEKPDGVPAVADTALHHRSPLPFPRLAGLHRPTRTKTEDSVKEDLKRSPPLEPGHTNDAKPVGLLELFRFSTKLEVFLDVIGLIAAAAAGSSQPVISVITGNLLQTFVQFGAALSRLDSHDPDSVKAFDQVKASFQLSAARDAAYITYVGVGVLVCTYVFMNIWVYTGEVNANRIRTRYLRAVLRQDVAFFDNVSAGEVATRIESDTHLIQLGISEKFALAVYHVSTCISGIIIAYIRSWRLALALSAMFPCVYVSGALMTKHISRCLGMSLDSVAKTGAVAEEVISSIRTAQAFGMQRALAKLYDDKVSNAHTAEVKAARVHGAGHAAFYFIIYASYALSFYFGTTLVIRGEATVATIANVMLAIMYASFALAFLAPELRAVTTAQTAAAKIFAVVDRVPAIDSESSAGLRPASVAGTITFDNVAFSYPSRPDVPVLHDLSISFPARRATAMVGVSGSGKSTIVNLVERFYDPLAGSVKLDGVDLRDLNVRWLRTQIGLVSQEPVLFSTTIGENVAHGLVNTALEHLSAEDKLQLIKQACIKANADEFISKLPLGYDTLVGEKGVLLSGGQKQRVAIARAIVSDPSILLLDEATSALDTQSEGIVQDALEKAAAGRTTITIAHRLSTIASADRIIVMGAGAVLESGTHDELLASHGAYAQLVAAQKLRQDAAPGAAAEGPAADAASEAADRDADSEKGEETGEEDIRSVSEVSQARRGKSHVGFWRLFWRMGTIEPDVRRGYLVASLFGVATGLVSPAYGIVYAKAVTTFEATDISLLRSRGDRNALWFFIIALLAMGCVGMQNWLFGRSGAYLISRLRSRMFEAVIRQDIQFFDQKIHSTGALMSSLTANPQKVNALAGIASGVIVQSTTTVIAGSIIGLIFYWKLALVAIATMPLLLSSGYIRMLVLVARDQDSKRAHQESAQLACEAAAAVRTVASLRREGDCCRAYTKCLEEPLKLSNRTSMVSNFIYAASQAMQFFVIALVFWYGSRAVSDLQVSTTRFLICLYSVTYAAIQAGNVFSFVRDISSAVDAASDIVELLDSRPAIDTDCEQGKAIVDVRGELVLRDVRFQYPSRPEARVLRGLDIVVKPGTYVALVGASGCGKSTIIQLIERFYDPSGGQILLDGQDISSLDIKEYRQHLALVSQEPTLYMGSIKYNILLGVPTYQQDISEEMLEAACRDANILDFIQSLPLGFDTHVGEKGVQLSGGQKQRIAIARALLRKPKILLLDEATSALDSASESVVQVALDQAAWGRTTIAVAHRLSSIQNADCIYFIKDGRVEECGTHDRLMALRGRYFEFAALQNAK